MADCKALNGFWEESLVHRHKRHSQCLQQSSHDLSRECRHRPQTNGHNCYTMKTYCGCYLWITCGNLLWRVACHVIQCSVKFQVRGGTSSWLDLNAASFLWLKMSSLGEDRNLQWRFWGSLGPFFKSCPRLFLPVAAGQCISTSLCVVCHPIGQMCFISSTHRTI